MVYKKMLQFFNIIVSNTHQQKVEPKDKNILTYEFISYMTLILISDQFNMA